MTLRVRQRPRYDVGSLTHPIAAHAPQVRLIGMNFPAELRTATPHARDVFRLAPWKTIERLEKPCSSE